MYRHCGRMPSWRISHRYGGAFLFLMVFGELLNIVGNKMPIVKTFLGGGAIILLASFLVPLFFG